MSGDIASGAAVQVFYDGTNFQLLNDANGQSETVTTLTATTKVVTPQIGSSSGSFTIQSANTTAITVDSSQNVGIGTSSPSVQLQATKPVLFDSSGVGVANSVAVGVGSSSTGLFWITGNSLGISTNGAERMRIDSSGKVGIGTSSPDRKLTVSMDVTDDNVILAKSAASNSYIGFADNGTSSQTGLSVRMGSAGNAMIFQTGGTTERMRIDSSGNVLVNSNTLYQYQPAPTSKSTTATLTGAELITGILNTTGTTYTVTLPTGTNIDAAVSSSLGVNGCFDWFVINTASGTITIGANGNTTLGTLTIATGVSAQFRFRKTAANTYTVYRMG